MSARWTEQEYIDHLTRRGAEHQCEQCKRVFVPKKLGSRHKGRFCSRECFQQQGKAVKPCERCGKDFKSRNSENRRFCSHQCAARSNHGAGNPVWKGGISKNRPERKCEQCGVTYNARPYGPGRFCSRLCSVRGIAKAGKENPNWRGGVSLACGVCGKAIWRQPALQKSEVAYCSRACFVKGEFSSRDAKRWQAKSKWGMAGTRSGRRKDLGDQYFRSRWEANYARYLEFLRSKGKIDKWEYEAETFEFVKIKKGTRFYTPDFTVTISAGRLERHEVKGWKHPKGETALKRMARYYPDIKIVLIDAPVYRQIASQVSKMINTWEH